MNIVWRNTLFSVLTGLAFCISAPAAAQYVWIDSNNVRHYSDKPPPPSVPVNRILKTPRGGPALAYEPVNKEAKKPDAAAVSAKAETSKAPLSTAEKNADYQKRKMEQAEKDKKAEEQSKRAAEKEKYCADQQERKRTLQSGQRLARIDAKGERYYMTEEERTKAIEETNQGLEQCK